MIEIGKTYAYEPGAGSPTPPSMKGRKGLVLAHRRNDLYEIRWPNGMTTVALADELKGPVEAARPGVDEPCLLCSGAKTITEYEPDPEREWIQIEVGEAPCPNCGGEVRAES